MITEPGESRSNAQPAQHDPEANTGDRVRCPSNQLLSTGPVMTRCVPRPHRIKETITYRMDGYDGVISRAPPSRNGGRTASSRSARAGWGETGCASDIQLPEEERQSIMRRVGSGELTVDQAMSIFNQVETQIKGDGADGGGPPAPAATVPGSTTRRKKAVATEVVGFDGPTHTHVAKAPRPKQHAADGIAPPPARGSAGWMMTAPGVVDGVLPGGAESIGPSALPPWSPGLHATIPPSVISAPFSLETTRARDSKRARQAGPDSTSFTSSGFALGSPATPAGRNRTGIPRQTSRTTATISALDGGRTPGGSRSRGSISRTVDRADAKPSAPRATPAAPSQPSHPSTVLGPCISISPLVNIAVSAQGALFFVFFFDFFGWTSCPNAFAAVQVNSQTA